MFGVLSHVLPCVMLYLMSNELDIIVDMSYRNLQRIYRP